MHDEKLTGHRQLLEEEEYHRRIRLYVRVAVGTMDGPDRRPLRSLDVEGEPEAAGTQVCTILQLAHAFASLGCVCSDSQDKDRLAFGKVRPRVLPKRTSVKPVPPRLRDHQALRQAAIHACLVSQLQCRTQAGVILSRAGVVADFACAYKQRRAQQCSVDYACKSNAQQGQAVNRTVVHMPRCNAVSQCLTSYARGVRRPL